MIKKFSIFIVTIIISGCTANVNRNATTVPKNKGTVTYSAHGGIIHKSDEENGIGFYPAVILDNRFGLTDSFEVGFDLHGYSAFNMLNVFFLNFKFAVFQNRNSGPSLAFASGVGTGFEAYDYGFLGIFSYKISNVIIATSSSIYSIKCYDNKYDEDEDRGNYVSGNLYIDVFLTENATLLFSTEIHRQLNYKKQEIILFNVGVTYSYYLTKI